MELSLFLTKFIGLYLVGISVALVLNKRDFFAIFSAMLANPHLMALSGALRLVLGLLLVLSHNVWANDWRVIITVLGWLLLASGVIRMIYPDFTIRMAKKLFDGPWYPLLIGVVFVFGLVLTYFGFWQ